MSLSCGFATNSTIPENAADAGYVPALHEFSSAGCADRSADRQSLGALRYSNQSQRLRSAAPLLGLIAALRLHLPFGSEAFWVLLALSQETR
jgi:hypothetical protein